MRALLFIIALLSGALTLLSIVSAFTTGGSDIQLIGAGVFLTVFSVACGLLGVMVRLEQIRDRKP